MAYLRHATRRPMRKRPTTARRYRKRTRRVTRKRTYGKRRRGGMRGKGKKNYAYNKYTRGAGGTAVLRIKGDPFETWNNDLKNKDRKQRFTAMIPYWKIMGYASAAAMAAAYGMPVIATAAAAGNLINGIGDLVEATARDDSQSWILDTYDNYMNQKPSGSQENWDDYIAAQKVKAAEQVQKANEYGNGDYHSGTPFASKMHLSDLIKHIRKSKSNAAHSITFAQPPAAITAIQKIHGRKPIPTSAPTPTSEPYIPTSTATVYQTQGLPIPTTEPYTTSTVPGTQANPITNGPTATATTAPNYNNMRPFNAEEIAETIAEGVDNAANWVVDAAGDIWNWFDSPNNFRGTQIMETHHGDIGPTYKKP